MAAEQVRRKLAAILAADMVSYTSHMHVDEEGTLAQLKTLRDDLIDPKIVEHRGRIFKTTGDGVLAEFQSVVDAIRCAVEIQLALASRNARLPVVEHAEFRLGVNLGDVIVEGSDLYGDGVNVAARLEQLAEPGTIYVSSDTYRQIKDKLDVGFADLGEHTLKNIAEPVRIYRILPDGQRGRRLVTDRIEQVLARPAIAVLPFENISGDAEQSYFSDGLSDDIITALTAWRSFPVIARSSSFAYKTQSVDAKRIGRELGARYLLEGGVRKGGNRLRVNAQLIDSSSGHHLWAERFDRDLEDVFSLQDEIGQRIVAIIEPTLERAELNRSTAKHPSNLDAWDYYLRGMFDLHRFTKEAIAQARDMFTRATALEPTYSRAYASLAWTHSRDLLMDFCDDHEASVAKLFEAAHRAVACDDLSSLAHHLLSTAYLWRNEHDLAIAEGQRSVELNPNDADALHALGNKLDLAGKPEGITRMEQAERLNPQDPQRHMHLSFLARAYLNAGDYERATACARQAVQRRPDYPHAYYILAIALGHLGRVAEARAALDQCQHLHPGFVQSRADWRPYTEPMRNAHLHEGLRKAGLAP